MTPTDFPESNAQFGPPEGMAEEQIRTIPALTTIPVGGSCDGIGIIVVAWQPTADELQQLNAGSPVFLTMLGGLQPHFISTNIEAATHPA